MQQGTAHSAQLPPSLAATIPLWSVRIEAPPNLRDLISATLAEESCGATDLLKENVLELIYDHAPDTAQLQERLAILAASLGAEVPLWQMKELPQIDWRLKVAAENPPRRIVNYIIFSRQQAAEWPGAWRLEIEASTAFGTGSHATTAGCLALTADLRMRYKSIKAIHDVGCGTGILGFAAARAWKMARLTLTDNDPEAITVTKLQARRNQLHSRLRAFVSHHVCGQANSSKTQQVDLLQANILLNPLCQMSGAIARRVRVGGWIILSGILTTQENALLAYYRARHFRLLRRMRQSGWSALLLKKMAK